MLTSSSPEEKELKIEAAKSKFVILLLGPGFPGVELAKRKLVAQELRKKNYKVIVMEEERDWLEYGTILDKFHDLLKSLIRN